MTQSETIIKYLETHKTIDFSKASRLGISQFHTRMKELRDIGYIFNDEWTCIGVLPSGNGIKIRILNHYSYTVYSWQITKKNGGRVELSK